MLSSFVSVELRPGRNSTWINDLNDEDKKQIYKVQDKMKMVPLGSKRVKLSEVNNYKSKQKERKDKMKLIPQVNNQEEETKMSNKEVNKIPSVITTTNDSKAVEQKEKYISKKLSWNNLFINQTYLLNAALLQQGVLKEWLNHSNNIERPFRPQMVLAKVEAIKRTKNRKAELEQLYKEEKEWDARPNDDSTENEDESSYVLPNWGEPWKNCKDEKYITNKELEIVLRKFFEENAVWDFSFLKTRFNPEKYVYPMYCPCGKIYKPWLENEQLLSNVKEDLGDVGLCHKNKFTQRVPFFDHIRQKATTSSIIHYGLMQYLLILYPN